MSQIINFNSTSNVDNLKFKQSSKPTSGLSNGDLWYDTSDHSLWEYYSPGANLWSDNVQTAWISTSRQTLQLFSEYDSAKANLVHHLSFGRTLQYGGSIDDLYPYLERIELVTIIKNAIVQNSTNNYSINISDYAQTNSWSAPANTRSIVTFSTNGSANNNFAMETFTARSSNSVANDINFPMSTTIKRSEVYLSTTRIGNPGLIDDIEISGQIIYRFLRRT